MNIILGLNDFAALLHNMLFIAYYRLRIEINNIRYAE